MIDRDQVAALANLVADGRFNFELTAGLETEGDLVTHRTGNPPVVGDASDG